MLVGARALPVQSPAAPPAAARPTSPARAAARASLVATDRAHAARSGRSLIVGFPTALDRDVILLYPDAPIVRSRAAAESLLHALPEAARRTLRWRPARVELAADGLRGYTLGYGTATRGDSSEPVRYLAYWRRTPAGAWHVAAWVLASGGAAPPLPSACAIPERGLERAGTSDAELRAADSTFSARSAHDGAGAAFVAVAAADALTLSGSPGMTCGPAAIEARLGALGPGALVWAPTDADVASSGDLGMSVGTATVRTGLTLSPTQPGPPSYSPASYSKYLTIWRRGRDGVWRFVADAGNSSPKR